HPLAGLTAAFAGVSGGFSANLMITSVDPLLGGMTIDAAKIIDPAYAADMNVAMNYYFIIVSVFLLTIVGAMVTQLIVEPRLGEYKGIYREKLEKLQPVEKKGLIWSVISVIVTVAIFALLVLPTNAPLRGEDGGIIQSPFMDSLVPIIAVLFFVPGLVYVLIAKEIRNDKDVAEHLSKTMATMGMFIVLSFAAGQFVAFFSESNMGLVIGVYGANFLESISLTGIPLLLLFIVISATINLF